MVSIRSGILGGFVATFAASVMMMMMNNAIGKIPELHIAQTLSTILGAPDHIMVGAITFFVIGTFLFGIIFAVIAPRLPIQSNLTLGAGRTFVAALALFRALSRLALAATFLRATDLPRQSRPNRDRQSFTLFGAILFGEVPQVVTPIARTAILVVLLADRLLLAETYRLDLLVAYAKKNHRLPNCLSAPLSERKVVFSAATVIAIPLNDDICRAMRAKVIGVGLNERFEFILDDILVKVEIFSS